MPTAPMLARTPAVKPIGSLDARLQEVGGGRVRGRRALDEAGSELPVTGGRTHWPGAYLKEVLPGVGEADCMSADPEDKEDDGRGDVSKVTSESDVKEYLLGFLLIDHLKTLRVLMFHFTRNVQHCQAVTSNVKVPNKKTMSSFSRSHSRYRA